MRVAIFRGMILRVKYTRPFNSRLDKSKLKEAGFTPLPTWQNAVERYIKYLKEQEQATGNE